jgi:anti-anti-sigma factor
VSVTATTPHLDVEIRRHAAGTTVVLSGVLDARTILGFEAQLRRALAERNGDFTLDLGGLDSLDLAAMTVVADHLASAAHQHGRLEIIPPDAVAPRRLLDLTGLVPMLARFAV